ncbi:MAG TPA: DUF1080 domain-containing protein [Methylomirabilota bacterium]|nr:DUF1080 domain-containing protein [Methylomirabilota bacterium]
MNTTLAAFLALALTAASALAADTAAVSGSSTNDWVQLFDGKTLNGWHVSAKTGHSRASKNTTGGKWVVQEGAITGTQDIPGNGGILLTDEKYSDFELIVEMNNDYGPDSGIFLRSDEEGTAYQALVDYHQGGALMGFYGEGKLGAKPSTRSFVFGSAPEIITPNDRSAVKLPVLPESWKFFWRHGQWNEFRVRIENNPPTITTWLNGVKWDEWSEPTKRHPDAGSIALQVHGGGDWTKSFVRYRNIKIRKLK